MVVHDKVYDCTSFVDEHPYVYHSRLPHSNSKEILKPLSTHPHPTQKPHSCNEWYHKKKEISIDHTTHHQHKEHPPTRNTSLTHPSQWR